MNIEDLNNTLMFLEDNKNLNVAVLKSKDIPLVKRFYIQTLGQPNKMFRTELYYKTFSIHIISLQYGNGAMIPRDIRNTLFYVRNEDEKDLEIVEKSMQVIKEPVRSIELWKSIGLDFHAMYRGLLTDGYSSEEAVSILKHTGVVV